MTLNYAQYLAAALEPDAIEGVQHGLFSYAVPSSLTKILIASFATKIGASGRMEQRNPQRVSYLRGVTLNGIQSTSTAIILDPLLPVYTDPWNTYYSRMQAIIESPVINLPFTLVNQKSPFLPGAYGAIITQYTCFNYAWLDLLPLGGNTGVNLWDEISDAATQRAGDTLLMPIHKRCAGEIHSSTTGSSQVGSVSYVLLPSTWSVIADPLGPYTFRDDFMGVSLDTNIWTRVQSVVGNVEINPLYQWLKLFGNSSWGANGIFRTTLETRATGKAMVVDVYVPQDAASGAIGVGWSTGTGQSFVNFAHLLNFAPSNILNIYENGTARGTVGSGYSFGAIYRIRVTLDISGSAIYEIQGGPEYPTLGGSVWADITPTVSNSASNTLTPAASAYAGSSYISDIRVY